MEGNLGLIAYSAAIIGFIHTVAGPDHYIPFVALKEARNWNMSKTIFVTVLCGLAHVLSSVVLGLIGVVIGVGVGELVGIEEFRGEIAGWILLGIGFGYVLWATWRYLAGRGKLAGGGMGHELGAREARGAGATVWVLFLFFVFGPCEPLIPLIMYPAASGGIWDVVMVAAVFGVATIGTMVLAVLILSYGLSKLTHRLAMSSELVHIYSAVAILICGISVVFLGA